MYDLLYELQSFLNLSAVEMSIVVAEKILAGLENICPIFGRSETWQEDPGGQDNVLRNSRKECTTWNEEEEEATSVEEKHCNICFVIILKQFLL